MDIIHKESPQVSRSGRMRIYLCNTCERESKPKSKYPDENKNRNKSE